MNEMIEEPEFIRDEPMSRHTSWRVGGPAERYLRPSSVEALQEYLRAMPADEPLTWIGLGSNLLVRDGGIAGTVIATASLPSNIEIADDGMLRADAGASCAKLARAATRRQLAPAAFFAGIPGTVGGALAMNAGAFGGETWNDVVSVSTIDRSGTIRERERARFSIGYRAVVAPAEEWFLAATFRFRRDEAVDMSAVKQMLARRTATQPTGQASCGSVFRNPPGQFAGALIEEAGLKGRAVGGASVSTKHANFIVNDGTATAADIETLIGEIREAVSLRSGIELELEVRVIGRRNEGEAAG